MYTQVVKYYHRYIKITNIVLVIIFCFFIYQIILKETARDENITESLVTQLQRKEIIINGKSTNSYLAQSNNEKQRGLSLFDVLPENESMLFVFEDLDTHSFWMKDMKFSIDIVWLNENKEIVYIKENAQPKDYPASYTPNVESRYVVEFNTGFVDDHHLVVGDRFYW